jgi:hypothetical protein
LQITTTTILKYEISRTIKAKVVVKGNDVGMAYLLENVNFTLNIGQILTYITRTLVDNPFLIYLMAKTLWVVRCSARKTFEKAPSPTRSRSS